MAYLAEVLDTVAGMCRDAEPANWTPEERDDVLRGLGTVAYEIPSLSVRIRAAKVNDTPVPHPVKPGPRPADPQPAAPPVTEPPPPPSPQERGRP